MDTFVRNSRERHLRRVDGAILQRAFGSAAVNHDKTFNKGTSSGHRAPHPAGRASRYHHMLFGAQKGKTSRWLEATAQKRRAEREEAEAQERESLAARQEQEKRLIAQAEAMRMLDMSRTRP